MHESEQDAYGVELARISWHQSAAAGARIRLCEVLAQAGVTREQADELVATRRIRGAHRGEREQSFRHV